MIRTPARLLAVGLAVATMCGVGVTVAAASQPSASVHGTEHITFASASASSVYSVIATGLFTDGGSINLATNTGQMKLGAGIMTVQPKFGKPIQTYNKKTCLMTFKDNGTYKIVGGTRKYAGSTGSGDFTFVTVQVNAHKANGTCSSRALAFQATVTLTGPLTLRH